MIIKDFEKYNFIDFVKSLNINFNDFSLSDDDFDHKSMIHGVNHVYRVMFNTLLIGSKIGDVKNTRNAFFAAFLHDLARKTDDACLIHGRESAKNKLPLYINLLNRNGATEQDIKSIKVAIENHSDRQEIEKDNPYYKTASILRDADGLDLVRLDRTINPTILRNEESRNLIDKTTELYNKTVFKKCDSFVNFLKDAVNIIF